MGKRDIVSNINFFMNVPVEADGTLGIVDGLSAPGKSLTLRADARHPGAGVELPADQQPLQRVRPHAGADGDHAAHDAPSRWCGPGMLTTVQDWPGRIGYWHIGVPPSGPMDDLSFRIGNRVLGNPEGAAGLECTRGGPALRFPDGGRVCVTGAPVSVTLDGVAVPQWQSVTRRPPAACSTSACSPGPGCGATCWWPAACSEPEYLGSTATFTLGAFGGHGGRPLRDGDVLTAGVDPGTARDGPTAAPGRRSTSSPASGTAGRSP